MKKNKIQVLIVLLTVLAVAAAAAAGYVAFQNQKNTEGNASATTQKVESTGITYHGEKYVYNSDIRTILIMGVDKDEVVTVKENTGRSGQSDFLVVAVLDQKNQTITLLQISRDAMTDVKIYGMDGDYLTTETAQVATQYAYGDGEKRSCQLTRDAVSHLLYDIRIHDYLSLNMAGISPIVDAIGGVDITVPQDYTAIDPAFVQGNTITLNGEQAEKYVRSRDITVTGSNTGRMERQTQFIQALLQKVQASEDGGNAMLQQFWSAGQPYMTTDMGLDTLQRLAEYSMNPEILTVPGEVRAGAEHDEFYVDEAGLQDLVINLFYTPK